MTDQTQTAARITDAHAPVRPAGTDPGERFLTAIARGSLAGFIDAEGRAAGCRAQIGTVAAGRIAMPALSGAAIRFFALARMAEGRPDLAAHGPLLREGARLAAAMVALLPNTGETRRQKQAILDAVRHDGTEARASLLIPLIKASLALPDGMVAIAMGSPSQHEDGPEAFVQGMMRQAGAAHRLLIVGDEAAARIAAGEVVAAILAFHAGTATTAELLGHRRRLRAVVSALADAGLLASSNGLAMLDAAAACDCAKVESLEAASPAAGRRLQAH